MCANCKDCKGCCKKGSCVASLVAKVLIIVGGLNWGLVGVAMLMNTGLNLNLVNLLFGSMPVVEAVVYILVGLAAIMSIFGCKCKICMGGTCEAEKKCACGGNCMEGKCDKCGSAC